MSFEKVPFSTLTDPKFFQEEFYVVRKGDTPTEGIEKIKLERVKIIDEDGEVHREISDLEAEGEEPPTPGGRRRKLKGGEGAPVLVLLSEVINPYAIYAVESDNATNEAREAAVDEEPNLNTVDLYTKKAGGRRHRKTKRVSRKKKLRKTRKY